VRTNPAFAILSLLIFVTVAFAAALISCSGANTSSPAAGFIAESSPVLSELDALEAPEGVNPLLFEGLKDALERALLAQGTGRAVCTPPTGDNNRVDPLNYYIEDVEGTDHYFLAWRYRSLGDYDLNGTVGIPDITPIAMHYGEDTNEHPEAAHIDGSGNERVGIEDITPIAMYYGVDLAAYRIEGSADMETGYAEVGTASFETDAVEVVGGLEFTYDLGEVPAYEWYRVVPVDSEGTDGVESVPVHIVPGGGGGLVIYLVTAAESGTGVPEDPFVVLVDTAYEIGVEDEQGNPFTEAVVLHLDPPFVGDVSDTAPYTVTPSGDLIGDFNVYATAEEDLVSNALYFRVEGLP
jgi:hypothetical protein